MPNACHITACQVDVTFGEDQVALSDINLDCPPGQFLALVGPSGCGKSTFLRCIAGLQQPTRGRIHLEATESGGSKTTGGSRTAYVFQDPTLLPWRNVLQNIALPLELSGTSRAARTSAARGALRRIGLAESDGMKRPAMLSGGMRMRVSLARALVTEPNVLLLDEPFAALDDISRQRLNEELMQIWLEQGWTGLFVTHNVAEAVFLSQRVIVMTHRPGRIAAEIQVPFEYPRPAELRARPEFAALTGEIASELRSATEAPGLATAAGNS